MRASFRFGIVRGAVHVGVAIAVGGVVAPVGADSPEGGARKAQACQACHGLEGLSRQPMVPHLAGQPREYFVKAMKAYRSGERKDEIMAIVTRSLSDRDIDDLAAYYSAIEINVKLPER